MHYHVTAGFSGCFPETDDIFYDLSLAQEYFCHRLKDAADAGFRFLHVYRSFDAAKYVDAEEHSTYYIEWRSCNYNYCEGI